MRAALVALACLVLTACGSSTPTAPTPPPPANVAGTWSGTVQYTAGGNAGVQAIGLNLTQAGSTVNGTYAAQSFSGTVTGATTTSSFSGTFTFNATTVSGAACTGTMAVSGDAGLATMTWTSPLVSASCTNTPTGITIAMQRR